MDCGRSMLVQRTHVPDTEVSITALVGRWKTDKREYVTVKSDGSYAFDNKQSKMLSKTIGSTWTMGNWVLVPQGCSSEKLIWTKGSAQIEWTRDQARQPVRSHEDIVRYLEGRWERSDNRKWIGHKVNWGSRMSFRNGIGRLHDGPRGAYDRIDKIEQDPVGQDTFTIMWTDGDQQEVCKCKAAIMRGDSSKKIPEGELRLKFDKGKPCTVYFKKIDDQEHDDEWTSDDQNDRKSNTHLPNPEPPTPNDSLGSDGGLSYDPKNDGPTTWKPADNEAVQATLQGVPSELNAYKSSRTE